MNIYNKKQLINKNYHYFDRGGFVGVEEEIFEEFFKKLEENEEIPKTLLNDLKTRYKNDNMDTKAKILRAIRLGDSNEN